jgi:uncharacterized lipoprotein NlpE involved in copper resistance
MPSLLNAGAVPNRIIEKMIKSAIILLITLSGMVACRQHPAKNPVAKPDTVMVSADTVIRYRSYSGILPCSDCEGIQTTINLMGDYSYQKLSSRLGRKGKIAGETVDETGRWMLEGRDTIHLMDVTGGPNRYLKTDSSLFQLDLNGALVTGPLANRFELKKVK